jgi:hypothetical protein
VTGQGEGREVRFPGADSPEGVFRKVRRHLRRRGWLLAFLAAGCVAAVVLIAAWALAGGGWRPGSRLPAALLLGGTAGALAALLLVARRLLRWTDERVLAREMEREAGLSSGALRAQMELGRSAPDGVSGSLIRAGARALLVRLTGTPRELAGGAGRDVSRLLRWTAGAAGALGLVVLLLLTLTPDRSRTAWTGLIQPHLVLAAGALAPLDLHPGDVSLPRGTIPEIRISAPGRSEATLHWQAVGEPLRFVTVEIEEDEALARLPPLEGAVRYWATAPDGARTPEREIVPSDPFLLSEIVIELRYPAYTRIPSETLTAPPAELAVPEGTRIGLQGRVEGDAGAEVILRGGEGDAVFRAPVQGGRFEGEWRPVRSGEVRWEVLDAPDHAALPEPMAVTVIPDRPPSVALPVPGTDGNLPPSFRLPLLLEASDDHGLAWVEIEAVRVRRDGARGEPVTDRIPAEGRRELSLRPVLDLVDWDLRPGEEVLLSARATDISPREQTSATREYRLRVPTASQLRDAARDRIAEAGDRVGNLAQRTRREAGDLRDLAREALMSSGQRGGGDFQAREELREAARARLALSAELDELRRGLEEARRSLEGVGDDDGGLRRTLRELGELMNELADPEERARMEELLERLAAGEGREAAEGLEEMARARAGLAERLEETLERLRHEALRESFRSAEEELRDLAASQEAVPDRLDTADGQAEQDALAERAAQMEERLEELARRLEARGDSAAASRTERASRELAEARDQMESASESGRSGDDAEASQEAREAAQQAREAQREMEEARQEWEEDWQDRMRDALARSADEALALARRQAELGERMADAGSEERGRLGGDEAALAEGIRSLGERLEAAVRQAPQLAHEVSEALGEAKEAVERAAEGLRGGEEDRGGARDSAERAVEALNRAALLALEGMDGVGEDGGSSGTDDALQQMEDLAGEQESINRDAQSMSDAGASEGARERLDEMAQRQEAVADAVEELGRRPGGERWNPGELDEMSDEAREIAQQLRDGRLDPETLDRQRGLLDRFLGAGRTFEQEGPTEERVGRPPGEVERRVVEPLPSGILQGTGLPLPSAEELARLSPAERRMVLEYFERLNRRSGGGGGP